MKQKTIYKIPPKEIRLELYIDESKNREYKGVEKRDNKLYYDYGSADR